MSERVAVIAATWRCGKNCMYCDYNFSGNFAGGTLRAFGKVLDIGAELNADQWLELLQKWGITRVEITGGEPTLRPDFADVLERLGGEWSITTNLTGDVMPWARIADKCVGFEASLHEWTNKGSFKHKLELLRGLGLPVSVTVVLSRKRMDTSESLVKWARKNRFRTVGHPEYGPGDDWSDAEIRQAKRLAAWAHVVVPLWEWPKPRQLECKAGETYMAFHPDGSKAICYAQLVGLNDCECPFPCDHKYARVRTEDGCALSADVGEDGSWNE